MFSEGTEIVGSPGKSFEQRRGGGEETRQRDTWEKSLSANSQYGRAWGVRHTGPGGHR